MSKELEALKSDVVKITHEDAINSLYKLVETKSKEKYDFANLIMKYINQQQKREEIFKRYRDAVHEIERLEKELKEDE